MDETFRTGYGRDWLDFAVTLINRYAAVSQDLVAKPAQLRTWLTEWGLAPEGPVTEDDVARARRLREALHGLAKAAALGRRPAEADVRVVDEALHDDVPVGLRRRGATVVASRPATTRQALARLARQAADDLTGVEPVRLRACGDDECSGVFLSVDVDVCDPGHAPGTGTPEPGGLSARDLLDAVRRIGRELPIAGIDVVEVSPPYDHAEITTFLANRVCLEALSGLAVAKHGISHDPAGPLLEGR